MLSVKQYKRWSTELKGLRIFDAQIIVFLCNILDHLVGLD